MAKAARRAAPKVDSFDVPAFSVILSSLPPDADRLAVRSVVSKCGIPSRIKMLPPLQDQRKAIVDFDTADAAAAAVALSGVEAFGRQLAIASCLKPPANAADKRSQVARKRRQEGKRRS